MGDDDKHEEVLNRGHSSERCRAFREDLSVWLDGELEAGCEAALRDHLETCAPCRRVRDGFSEVDAVLRSLPQPVLSENFSERLRDRIQGDQGQVPATQSSQQVIVLSRARRAKRVAQITAMAAGLAGVALFAAHYWDGGVAQQRPGVVFVEPSDDELLISIQGEAIEDLEFLEALDVLEKMAQDDQNQGATGGQTS